MKKTAGLFSILLLFVLPAAAQILKPVKWEWKAIETGKGEYTLVFTATIDKGWHTYSQFMEQGGPIPTSFTYNKNDDVKLVGKATEKGPKYREEHSALFDNMLVKYFDESLVTEQKIKVLKDTKLTGTIEYMACDDSRCLPPDDKDFSFDLKGEHAGVQLTWDSSRAENTPVKKAIQKKQEQSTFDSTVQSVITQSMQKDSLQQAAVPATTYNNRFGKAISDCGEEKQMLTLWLAIVLGFGAGLLALVTPCVFPMIPLTVSFFIKRGESKSKGRFEALTYTLSIVLIYFFASLPFLVFHVSSDAANELSTNVWLNVFFFGIFVVFALSFFGLFEITLPSFIANKADSASNFGGVIGIFFMAVTLAIVSFSCTGPILGGLFVAALHSGHPEYLVAAMTSFGLALGLPFGVFALFPKMMKSLPKSGSWLNSVKVIIGFMELIFALKFLSNADLVAHWGLLKREVFLGIWALLGIGAFAYLMGWIKFSHDSGSIRFSPIRTATAIFALSFSSYCIYGAVGNGLPLLSGFPPPKFYSLLPPKKSDLEPIRNNYEAALARARAEHKPVMIDFTGWACVNCRKMEENVWPEDEVLKRLKDKYVVVSLYVDDKELLPEKDQYVSNFFAGKKIRTVGNKFSEFEAKYFDHNTQPYYVLITPDEKLLTNPKPYTADVQEYITFLDCGINTFHQVSQR